MSNPLIFIHYGFSNYIEKSIRLASKQCDRIIFIGDGENKHIVANITNVEFFYIDDYRNEQNVKVLGDLMLSCMRSAKGRDYIANNYYRFFCIEKWIILSNFLNSHPEIKKLYHFDTDNFILQKLPDYNLDFIRFYSIGIQSFLTAEIVAQFANYILSVSNKLFYDENIMTLSTYFINSKEFNYITGDINDQDDMIYDKAISVNSGNKYEMFTDKQLIKTMSYHSGDMKMIYYDDNKNLYIKRISDNKFLKLINLNMSWVTSDFLMIVYYFLSGHINTIPFANFKRIDNEQITA